MSDLVPMTRNLEYLTEMSHSHLVIQLISPIRQETRHVEERRSR